MVQRPFINGNLPYLAAENGSIKPIKPIKQTINYQHQQEQIQNDQITGNFQYPTNQYSLNEQQQHQQQTQQQFLDNSQETRIDNNQLQQQQQQNHQKQQEQQQQQLDQNISSTYRPPGKSISIESSEFQDFFVENLMDNIRTKTTTGTRPKTSNGNIYNEYNLNSNSNITNITNITNFNSDVFTVPPPPMKSETFSSDFTETAGLNFVFVDSSI